MLIAKPLLELSELDPKEFQVFWLPYVCIKYRSGRKKREMAFDSVVPKLAKDPLLYVALMRNPKHVKIVEAAPEAGTIIPTPLANGEFILETLATISEIAKGKTEDAREAIRNLSRSLLFQLFFPVQITHARRLDAAEEFLRVYSILDAAGLTGSVEYLEERIIFWPIAIRHELNLVYELALQRDPSNSYTFIHEKFDIPKLLGGFSDE